MPIVRTAISVGLTGACWSGTPASWVDLHPAGAYSSWACGIHDGQQVGYASSGTWSGGAGTFSPSASAPNATYTPTAAEIAAGGLTLTLTTKDAAPLTQFIASYSSPEGLFWAKLSAASTMAIAPILVLGWFAQKQLVRGLTFGAVK